MGACSTITMHTRLLVRGTNTRCGDMRALSVGTEKGLVVPGGANLKTSNDSTTRTIQQHADFLGTGR